MATWQTEEHGEWTCGDCGRVYKISCTRYPGRDSVELYCDCGRVIFKGNTTRDYHKKFVRQGSPEDSKKNSPLD